MGCFFPSYSKDFEALPFLIVWCWVGTGACCGHFTGGSLHGWGGVLSSACCSCSITKSRHVQLFATPWTAACPASLTFTTSRSLLKLMFIESVIPSNHLILCRCPLLLPSVFPSIRVFSSELVLRIRWPKYWSFSFSISPSSEYSGLICCRIDWFD